MIIDKSKIFVESTMPQYMMRTPYPASLQVLRGLPVVYPDSESFQALPLSLLHSGGHGVLDCLESHTVLKQAILIAYQGFTGFFRATICASRGTMIASTCLKMGHYFSNLHSMPSMILNITNVPNPGGKEGGLVKLTDKIIRDDKIELRISSWSSTSIPVPKKKPMIINESTMPPSMMRTPYPESKIFCRNNEIQNLERIRFKLKEEGMKLPLKEEHRHITCMSTPKDSYQLKVLVMGLKNGNAIFQ
jgi:hypothetical protein